MSKRGHVATRMCIGCRKKKRKEEMVRLTKRANGFFLLNGKKNFTGRGYYLCPNGNCLRLAQKKERAVASLELKNPFGSSIEEGILA